MSVSTNPGFSELTALGMKFYEEKLKLILEPERDGEYVTIGEETSLTIFVREVNKALMGAEMLVDTLLEIDYRNLTFKITK